MQYKIDRKSH